MPETPNLFGNLALDDPGDGPPPGPSSQTGVNNDRPRAQRPRPIVLNYGDPHCENLMKEIRAKLKNSVTFVYCSVGIKIVCNDRTSYDRIMKYCLKNKVKFFTHDIKAPALKKFTISGLCDSKDAIDSIKLELLEDYDLTVKDVVKIPPKVKRHDKDCIYLLSFDKGVTNKAELDRNIRYLMSTRIRWNYYRDKPKPPTLCKNCYLFGHGMRNCHLNPRCNKCAGENSSDKCTSRAKTKCRNCNGDHHADDLRCPARAEFIEMRSRQGSGNANRQSNNNSGRLNNIPQDRQPRSRSVSRQRQRVTVPPVPPMDGNNFPVGLGTLRKQDRRNNNNVNSGPSVNIEGPPAWPHNNQSELFSPAELMGIMSEMLSSLRGCTNKRQQLQALFEITIKYLND
ncbi:hypothetical protein DMENIID0001_075750 [Sergentomyia squamirostris]